MAKIAILLVAFLIVSGACAFKRQPSRGVISYSDGKIFLVPPRYYARGGLYYGVGELPAGWERMSTRARTISWYNREYRSSISTDAFCGRTAENRSLASLGSELVTALDARKYSNEREFRLGDRSALRQTINGTVDGVPTEVDLVVVMKDGCAFDFYLVSQGAPPKDAVAEFEAFFAGFSFQR